MANPIMNNLVQDHVLDSEPMTVNGSINKSLLLLALIVISACYTWNLAFNGFVDKVNLLMIIGLVVGTILAFVIIFVQKGMNILAPMYAVAEGLFIGGISAAYSAQYAGIVIQAITVTFATLGVMLMLFKAGVIQCTDKFRATLITATLSIAVIYLIQIIASFFNRGIPQIFTASPIGIGFSVIVCLIAALNLIIDFDFIKRGSQNMLPKSYEWYGAFGLMVSLIWLYLEVLRLLAKVNSRR